MDRRDRARVLRRQRDEHRGAVHAGGGERLQVGLDAGAAALSEVAIVSAAELASSTPFAGMTRIRFDGCDLSPVPGPADTPVSRSLVHRRHWRADHRRRDGADRRAPDRRGARLPRRGARRATRARHPCPPSSTRACAAAIGVEALYTHQRAAWEAAARGEHLVVTTGTASGKTLAFNLPVLDSLARDPKNRALYLYPTKALAQDQFRALSALPRAAAAAGDLRRRHADRAAAADPQVGRTSILTNPDMVHIGAAPEPRALGRRAREPPLRRRRRGARLPRRLRLARRERPAAAAPARPDLRLRAAVPARLGDDREPRRARPRACSARPSPWSATTRRRGPSGRSCSGTRRCSTPSSACAGRRSPRRRSSRRRSSSAACGRSRSRRAARRPSSSTASPPSGSATTRGSRPTAPATRRSSGARSSGGSPRASCSASRRRTRSSSGSTSACSTR